MQIVDTHQHLWDIDLFRYSWLDSVPQLNRSFRMADYLSAVQGLNVVKSVHLEADVDEPYMLDETRHLLALAERADNPLEGIVACGRPESEDFRSYHGQDCGVSQGKRDSTACSIPNRTRWARERLSSRTSLRFRTTVFPSISAYSLGSYL